MSLHEVERAEDNLELARDRYTRYRLVRLALVLGCLLVPALFVGGTVFASLNIATWATLFFGFGATSGLLLFMGGLAVLLTSDDWVKIPTKFRQAQRAYENAILREAGL